MVTSWARVAREAGLYAALDGTGEGLAAIGVVRLHGPDAASFLHSQVTNTVTELEVGQGNESARVARTGHLQSLFSVHRVADQTFLLLTESTQAASLAQGLESMHFADDLSIDDTTEAWRWAVVQGPLAADAVQAALGGEPTDMERCGSLPHPTVPGGLVLRRSFTGDVGFLVGLPASEGSFDGLRQGAIEAGCSAISVADYAIALEVLRIEAGHVRIGPDTPRKTLLPETGLEGRTVSYTKGCYIGQEVIARVRTYGSVPRALRALVLEVGRKGPERTLGYVPAPGQDVVLADGTKAGWFASRTLSPVLDGPVVLAYLTRAHRTPGNELVFWGERGPIKARVALLPIYSAPDQASRAAWLYDQAIRTFAGGGLDRAIDLLGQCLQADPAHEDAYEAIGVMLGRAGRFHEAIDFFKRLEEFAPDEPMVHTNLSLYYMKLGDKTTAEEHSAQAMVKAIAKGRDDGRTAVDIAQEQSEARQRDAERKRGMFEQVLGFDPADPIALFGLGRALAVLGDAEGAAAQLAQASEVDRNNSAVYLEHGKALEALSRTSDALAVYRAGIEVASRRGDLMPLKEMEHRSLLLSAP